MTNRKARKRTVPSVPVPAPRKRRAPKPEKFTVKQAFNYFYLPIDGPIDRLNSYEQEEEINLERGLRSITYLLHFFSNVGNETIDGNVANGLAWALDTWTDRATEFVSGLRMQHEERQRIEKENKEEKPQ